MLNNAFTAWLASKENSPFRYQDDCNIYQFVREAKNEQFDYLFSLRLTHRETVSRDCCFKYAGIYCRQDSLLYDGNEDLKLITGSNMQARTLPYFLEALQKDVRAIVEQRLGNDRSRLRIAELTDYSLRGRMEDNHYYAKERARSAYLDTVEFVQPVYRCSYEPARWTEEALLSYILDPDVYTENEVTAFFADNQEDILSDMLYNDAIIAEYEALLADRSNAVHIVKKIMAAMSATTAKKVNVTVLKNGEEFTFKTEAGCLCRDCTSYYNTWNIVGADRREFERRFGRNEEYYPQEIVRITYARAVLYEAAT